MIRKVRGCCTARLRGEPVATVLPSGAPGLEPSEAALRDGAREVRCWRSNLELAEGGAGESFSFFSSFIASGVASRSNLPGCGLLELEAGASALASGLESAAAFTATSVLLSFEVAVAVCSALLQLRLSSRPTLPCPSPVSVVLRQHS